MAESIRVAVRVRPFNERELRLESKCVVRMNGAETVLLEPDADARDEPKRFTFDYSYWSHDARDATFASQQRVFDDLGTLVLDNAFRGYNVSLFAYGQTGAGKSYSVVGYKGEPGLVPRVSEELFKWCAKKAEADVVYRMQVSMLEIYNEKVRDLLNPAGTNLRVREHPKTGPYVEDLSRNTVKSYAEVAALMAQGSKARTVAATTMNSTSSRAHTIFTLTFTQTRKDRRTLKATDRVSKINLIDLAGSERIEKTGAVGTALTQACYINKSLSTLGLVIAALASTSSGQAAHVPYRDSALTWLLKESLGGNAKTIMIAAISPAADNYEETLSTLRYANRVKMIKNTAVVNEDPNVKVIRELRAELETLRKQLASSSNASTDEVERLRDELEQSRQLIASLSMTTDEENRESEALARDRAEQLARMGGGIVDRKLPHLVNLNEDPLMSESLVYSLASDETVIGAAEDCSMRLEGLGMEKRHAIVRTRRDAVMLESLVESKTFVNGEPCAVGQPRALHQGDRVIFGLNQVFRMVHPAEAGSKQKGSVDEALDWDAALRELAATQNRSIVREEASAEYQERLAEIKAQHERDEAQRLKEAKEMETRMKQLQAERASFEKQLAKERANTAAQAELVKRQRALEAEAERMRAHIREREDQHSLLASRRADQERALAEFSNHIARLVTLTNEANEICAEMGKPQHFEVEVVPHVDVDLATTVPEPCVRVEDYAHSLEFRLSGDDFVALLERMRDVYQNWKHYGEPEPDADNPFDLEPSYQLIGSTHVSFAPLLYLLDMEVDEAIVSVSGEQVGTLSVSMHPANVPDDLDLALLEPEDMYGRSLDFTVQIQAASALPRALSLRPKAQFHFFQDARVHATRVRASAASLVPARAAHAGARAQAVETQTVTPQFHASFPFHLDFVTRDMIERMQQQMVPFEVLGLPVVHGPDVVTRPDGRSVVRSSRTPPPAQPKHHPSTARGHKLDDEPEVLATPSRAPSSASIATSASAPHSLTERETQVAMRARELERREAELDARSRELERREAMLLLATQQPQQSRTCALL